MNRSKFWLFIALGIFLLVLVVIILLDDTAQIERKIEADYLPKVSVVEPTPKDNKGYIRAYAEVKPHWAIVIKAQVNGEIINVSDKALAGNYVEKRDFLIQIEDSVYKANVYEAEQALSVARLNLLQEQKKSEQALRDWQRSGIQKKPLDLVLNKPQLDIARKMVSATSSQLDAARKMLAYTKIQAPFSGYITSRHISIRQTIAEGDELLNIRHDALLDIEIYLSSQQMSQLDTNWNNQFAAILNAAGVQVAQARIVRGGGFLDPETRQYRIFLEVDKSNANEILAGDFVQVLLPGRVAKNSLIIPESALTRDGFVWYVDDNNDLRRFAASALFHLDDHLIVDTPTTENLTKDYPARWRIATTPLALFLVGKRVNPLAVVEE